MLASMSSPLPSSITLSNTSQGPAKSITVASSLKTMATLMVPCLGGVKWPVESAAQVMGAPPKTSNKTSNRRSMARDPGSVDLLGTIGLVW